MQDYQQQGKTSIITFASGLVMVAAILVVYGISVCALSLLSATSTITLTEEQSAAFRSAAAAAAAAAALLAFGIVMIATGISLAGACQMLSS